MKTKAEARDVWWCYILNEPGVIEFEGDYPKCSVCSWVDKLAIEQETSQSFRNEHTFCSHIERPVK